jgi:hypothetical protein
MTLVARTRTWRVGRLLPLLLASLRGLLGPLTRVGLCSQALSALSILSLGAPCVDAGFGLGDVVARNCEHIATPSGVRPAIFGHLHGVRDANALEAL